MSRSLKVAATGLVALLGSVAAVAPGTAAFAATCSTSSHCYGEVTYYSSSQFWGLEQGLNVSCLGPVSSPSSNFVTEEMWLITANSSGADWVEEGMAYGNPQGSKRYFYWADSRPNGGGYHEHDLSISANLHQTYDDTISWNGSGWDVNRDGSHLGTSTSNPGQSHYAEAGEELTVNSGAAAAESVYLYRQMSYNGAWNAGWGGSVTTDNPPYGGWENAPYSADFYSNCSFAAANSNGPTFHSFTDASAGAAVTKVVADLAVANGGAAPQAVTYVKTTRQAAATLTSQAKVDSDQPVYLATFTGQFTGKAAKTPHGTTTPQGKTMTAAIDPATGRITDWGIEQHAVRLAALGQVRHAAK
jgi:hypothetical protein